MKKEKFDLELLDEHMKVASTTECTGLIQIPPTNEEEAEAYREIYVIPEQKHSGIIWASDKWTI